MPPNRSDQVRCHEIPTNLHMGRHRGHKPKNTGLVRRPGIALIVPFTRIPKKLCDVGDHHLPTMEVKQRDFGQYTAFLDLQALWPAELVWRSGEWLVVHPRHLFPSLVNKPTILVVSHDRSAQCFSTMHSELYRKRSYTDIIEVQDAAYLYGGRTSMLYTVTI